MRKIAGFTLAVCLSLLGCQREETPRDAAAAGGVTLKLVGSSTMAPLVAELAKVFQASRPNVKLAVESGGSGRGVNEARAGTADIGMASRALTEKESDLVGFSIARDGICFIVHAENPVRAITTAQVRDIFAGRIANWKGVGGADAPISVVTRPQGYSSLEVFSEHLRVKADEIKASSAAGENDHAIKAVAADRNAITFVSVGEAERRAAAGEPIRLLTFDGIVATSENIRNGKYVLSRSLTLVTRSLPKGEAKAFIEFAMSPRAAPIIRKYDFVPYVD